MITVEKRIIGKTGPHSDMVLYEYEVAETIVKVFGLTILRRQSFFHSQPQDMQQ